jgi:hypothetical protein
MHLPHEGDQPFLNRFYEYRHFGLPHVYNLNLVLFHWFPLIWEFLWPKAKIVHFTVRKPGPPEKWCIVNCPERVVLEWYADVFTEMLEVHGYDKTCGIVLMLVGSMKLKFMDDVCTFAVENLSRIYAIDNLWLRWASTWGNCLVRKLN